MRPALAALFSLIFSVQSQRTRMAKHIFSTGNEKEKIPIQRWLTFLFRGGLLAGVVTTFNNAFSACFPVSP
ncbi:hypothetical protein J3R30DRAFT_3580678 [Lentinula aciculospora]|uniref:Secreted protein n=1 Tax=Lentinula aciculospora TaxID=153920 RepID=A0A9W8ZTE6_9AGAR|nr:hypothetical protein J3R30DRAFT_3589732 [Lentinula aciculospora]KAJ4467077.1 hypothetical protein J3R30DRAFT_3580678 [Lentinula aciculospora]